MRKPQMILFDYGQTLFTEQKFDGVAGIRALLAYAVQNPQRVTAEQLQREADELNEELGRFDLSRPQPQVEITNRSFQQYLFERHGIEFSISAEERETLFWDNSSPGRPTDGIPELLEYLHSTGIRTGVVSNIAFSGQSLRKRIEAFLPDHHFEFILASSEYVFRKPNRRLFELACIKAGLRPEEIWFCGDRYAVDIAGAKAVGMFPILYTGASESVPLPAGADAAAISAWPELRALLERAE